MWTTLVCIYTHVCVCMYMYMCTGLGTYAYKLVSTLVRYCLHEPIQQQALLSWMGSLDE